MCTHVHIVMCVVCAHVCSVDRFVQACVVWTHGKYVCAHVYSVYVPLCSVCAHMCVGVLDEEQNFQLAFRTGQN